MQEQESQSPNVKKELGDNYEQRTNWSHTSLFGCILVDQSQPLRCFFCSFWRTLYAGSQKAPVRGFTKSACARLHKKRLCAGSQKAPVRGFTKKRLCAGSQKAPVRGFTKAPVRGFTKCAVGEYIPGSASPRRFGWSIRRWVVGREDSPRFVERPPRVPALVSMHFLWINVSYSGGPRPRDSLRLWEVSVTPRGVF